MKLEFPVGDGPLDERWTAPLERIAEMLVNDPRYQFFDLADFMVMGRVKRGSRPDVTLYKHRYTRAEICLDDDAQPYRFIAPKDIERGTGRFVPHLSLRHALDELCIWQLPWLKPGLERYQFGRSWEDSWQLRPDSDPRHIWPEDPAGWDDWIPPDEAWEPAGPSGAPRSTRLPVRRWRPEPSRHLRLVTETDDSRAWHSAN